MQPPPPIGQHPGGQQGESRVGKGMKRRRRQHKAIWDSERRHGTAQLGAWQHSAKQFQVRERRTWQQSQVQADAKQRGVKQQQGRAGRCRISGAGQGSTAAGSSVQEGPGRTGQHQMGAGSTAQRDAGRLQACSTKQGGSGQGWKGLGDTARCTGRSGRCRAMRSEVVAARGGPGRCWQCPAMPSSRVQGAGPLRPGLTHRCPGGTGAWTAGR